MPIRELDSTQKLAATSGAAEVIVSAGAGSGKTSLLVGRYLYEVMANAVPLSGIAAITFTNKAAGQMKARIAGRVPDLAKIYPEHAELWAGLAEHVHTAPISTIHAFCNAILRAYPLEAGIDPLFEILDETTLAGLRNDAWRRFLDIRLDDDPERYGILVRALGVGGLRKLIMSLMDHRAEIIVHLDAEGVPGPAEIESRTRTFLLRRMGEYRDMLRNFHAIRPGSDSLSLSVEAFLFEWEEIVRSFEDGGEHCPAAARIRDAAGGYARAGSKEKWASAGIPRDEIRSGLKECLTFLDLVESWQTRERGVATETAALVLDEFTRFERFFLDLKKSRSALDNDDSLIETWRLLRRSAPVCRKVSASYRHILVDEFQDTDTLQLDILRMITGNSSASLFTVGDPKQSIYRFRGADVTVFNRFTLRNGVDFHPLAVNYRSYPAVIGFVNHAFTRILGTGDGTHPDFEAAYAPMTAFRKDSGASTGVEVAVFEADGADERRSREGAHIARRARELNAGGCPFGRMAILLRKGTQSRRYEEALLRADVPFVNLAGGDPFGGPEAYDVANLLGWLGDPDDQALFTGVLLSPFFRADANLLCILRQAAGKHGSLSATFLRADFSAPEWEGTGAAGIGETLRELLSLSGRCSIRELLDRAFERTGYTLTLLADPIRGEGSLAAVDLLLRAADTFEDGGGSFPEFARLLRDRELKSDRSSAIETRDDALTIITIHKSKGLEYDVVFLADASGQPKSDSPPWLLHDELGLGVALRDDSGRTVKTLALSLARETEKRKALAESKRLFYVACTRAARHLVITGGRPSKKPDPSFEKDNWMGWLFDAFGIPREGEDIPARPGDLCSWMVFPLEEVPEKADLTDGWRKLFAQPETDNPDDTVLARLSYPDLRVSGKPSTLSPTQAEDYLACPALYAYRRVHRLDLDAGEELTDGYGARYGDLAHHVLARWDYHDHGRLAADVERFAPRDIPESDRSALRNSLARFARSPLCREISAADEVRKEEPFAFLEDGILIRGKIDLAVRTGDRWTIVDYKTNRVRSEDTARAAERYRFQTGVYALALLRAEHAVPGRLVIHFLTPGITREFPCGQEVLDDVAATLGGIAAALDRGEFRPRPSERCGTCSYRRLCGK